MAIDRDSGRFLAVGNKALQMHEKTHENIKTIRPLKDGVIADFHAAEEMIRAFIRMIYKDKQRWIRPQYRMIICIPSGITDVEKRRLKIQPSMLGARCAFIQEPMAQPLELV